MLQHHQNSNWGNIFQGCFFPPVDLDTVWQAICGMTASPGKTQGFITYWIWTNLVTRRAVKFQCNGQTPHKDTQYKEDMLAVPALSVKREVFEKNFWSSCDKTQRKHTRIPMNERSICSSSHTQYKKNTPFSTIFLPRSVINTFYRVPIHTHTPNQWSPLGMAHASKMRQRNEDGGGGGNKSRFTRPVPAPVSNFILSSLSDALQQWHIHARAHTHTHTHSLFLLHAHTLWCVFLWCEERAVAPDLWLHISVRKDSSLPLYDTAKI